MFGLNFLSVASLSSVAAVVALTVAGASRANGEAVPARTLAGGATPALQFTVKDIKGNDVNLADKYAGKVVLLVNVASKCGFTKQYDGLQKLYEKDGPKGFVILGFPSNDFGGQEPGTEEQIAEFCSAKFNVKFDLFSKVKVNGAEAAPLYQYLTSVKNPGIAPGPISWNFEKFLISKDGQVVGRYKSKVTPESEELNKAIDAELAK